MSADQVIDNLESMLRQLDRQHALLDEVIANINAVAAPSTGDARRRLSVASDSSSDWEFSHEQDQIIDSDEDDGALESSSVFTTFYHSDMWGVHPRGVDRPMDWWEGGYESGSDSDTETFVGEWEDPSMTPMKRLAPVAAGYYSPFDDHMD